MSREEKTGIGVYKVDRNKPW